MRAPRRGARRAPRQDCEVLRVRIASANTGGLLTTVESLPAFIPYSHVLKNGDEQFSVVVRRPARALPLL